MIIIYTILLYFFSLYVIKKSIFFFNKYSIIDFPSKRSNHKTPTPKGAGLIIIPTVVISTLIFFYFIEKTLYEWITILFLCVFLGVISFIDDVKNLSIKLGFPFSLSKKIIEDLIIIYLEMIKNNNLVLKNVGSFKLVNKKERLGRNPKTNEEYLISKRRSVRFIVSKNLYGCAVPNIIVFELFFTLYEAPTAVAVCGSKINP